MSSFIYGYDNDEGTVYIECDIQYDTCEGAWEQVPGGYGYQRYYVGGEIYVNSVEVLFAEYYDPHGNVIAKIKAEDMQEDARKALNLEVEAYVEQLIDDGDVLCDDLWECRG